MNPSFRRSILVLVAGLMLWIPAHASDSFSSYSKTCPVGYGCVYTQRNGKPFSHGWDLDPGYPENYFRALPYSESTGQAILVRNRNATTRRSVVIATGGGSCIALRYDSRTWVSVPYRYFRATSMGAVRMSRPPGTITSTPCASTRWI